MLRKVVVSVFAVVVLVGGGIGVAALLEAARPKPPKREFSARAPVVRWAELQSEDVTEAFIGYGTAEPDRKARLAAQISGVVVELVGGIESGTRVKKGQALVRVDSREYRLALVRANAQAQAEQASLEELESNAQQVAALIDTAKQEMRVARDERSRLADLYERGQAAKKEFDFANLAFQQAKRVLQGYQMELAQNGPQQRRVRASIESYKASAELAQLNVERCVIVAPFTGSIDKLSVEVGDRLAIGQVLLTLVDSSRVQVPLQLPVSAYSRVAIGGACELTSDAAIGLRWQGTIARMAPAAEEQSRTFAVYVDVESDKQKTPLIPGMFVRATIYGATYTSRLLVPRSGIRRHSIWIFVDGRARRRNVAIERLIGERAIVEGDLAPGDRVILSQLSRLVDGAPVRLWESAVGPAATADVVAFDGSQP